MLRFSAIVSDLFDGPREGCAQRFRGDGATRLADGRQSLDRPFLEDGLPKLSHKQTVRQHHQIHVPRLALAAAELTGSQAQFVIPVVVIKCDCPAMGLRR